MGNCCGDHSRIKPTVSLDLLRHLLHFDTPAEALEGLKEIGLEIPLTKSATELTEDECIAISIPSAEGLQSLRSHQQAEKGTKLL